MKDPRTLALVKKVTAMAEKQGLNVFVIAQDETGDYSSGVRARGKRCPTVRAMEQLRKDMEAQRKPEAAKRLEYIERRVKEIHARFDTETKRRRAFANNCGTKEERQAYCKRHGIRGKDMEVILNIHRRK